LVSVYCPAACCFFPSHSLAQGFPIWGTCTPGGTFAYLKRYIQGRNEIRWRPGQETSLAPLFETGLSEANILYRRKCLWHCWDFSAPPQWFCPPSLIDSASGDLRLPSYACGHIYCILYSRNKLTSRHKIDSTYSSINIQWIFVILLSLFVIKNL